MMYNVSQLKDEDLKALQALEREIGTTLVAFSPLSFLSEQISDEQLAKLQALETKIGVVLVAVRH